jgi:hypothetical protein
MPGSAATANVLQAKGRAPSPRRVHGAWWYCPDPCGRAARVHEGYHSLGRRWVTIFPRGLREASLQAVDKARESDAPATRKPVCPANAWCVPRVFLVCSSCVPLLLLALLALLPGRVRVPVGCPRGPGAPAPFRLDRAAATMFETEWTLWAGSRLHHGEPSRVFHSGALRALTRSRWLSMRSTTRAERAEAMATTRTAKA